MIVIIGIYLVIGATLAVWTLSDLKRSDVTVEGERGDDAFRKALLLTYLSVVAMWPGFLIYAAYRHIKGDL